MKKGKEETNEAQTKSKRETNKRKKTRQEEQQEDEEEQEERKKDVKQEPARPAAPPARCLPPRNPTACKPLPPTLETHYYRLPRRPVLPHAAVHSPLSLSLPPSILLHSFFRTQTLLFTPMHSSF